MTEVTRVPAVPALLDDHLTNEIVEVIIRTQDGQEFDVTGVFRSADLHTEFVEVDYGVRRHYIPTERHFHLHLVMAAQQVRIEG